MANFAPVQRLQGYLRLKDLGLIGDGTTAALAGRDGSIVWMCLPRFDSPPLFCEILDAKRGGRFRIAPAGLQESRQRYDGDSGVLITEMRANGGLVELTDALTLHTGSDLREGVSAGRKELLRQIRVLQGDVELEVDCEPYGGADAEPSGDGLHVRSARRPDLNLHFSSSRKLEGLNSRIGLKQGETAYFRLGWCGRSSRYQPVPPEKVLEGTLEAWRKWMIHFRYEGPLESCVRRSAITLKLLDHFESGSMVAAPTSSLPEAIGGVRNWDYRYAWIRDAAFSVYALHRIGFSHEAAGFLAWVLDSVERHGRPRVLHTLDGEVPPPEREDPELEGYRGSRPVRWGNAAAEQRQHDVYGEILDSAYQWASHHGKLDEGLWQRLTGSIEAAGREWHTPDHGIWEVRTPGRVFTYSAALCQVALDRGARLAERFHLPGRIQEWRNISEHIREAILTDAWDAKRNSLTEHLGGGDVDASLLSLPLRRVIPADHPKMAATTQAVMDRLGAGGGLLYRYNPDRSPDGLPGHEGAFVLCSFWYVDNLAKQGRVDEALSLFESLCARSGELGLLPEQIDPGSGEFRGNYPQAFSHIGAISSGVNLARSMKKK